MMKKGGISFLLTVLGLILEVRSYIGALLILVCPVFLCPVEWIFDSHIVLFEYCLDSNPIFITIHALIRNTFLSMLIFCSAY